MKLNLCNLSKKGRKYGFLLPSSSSRIVNYIVSLALQHTTYSFLASIQTLLVDDEKLTRNKDIKL
jgi:hypothetical protein